MLFCPDIHAEHAIAHKKYSSHNTQKTLSQKHNMA